VTAGRRLRLLSLAEYSARLTPFSTFDTKSLTYACRVGSITRFPESSVGVESKTVKVAILVAASHGRFQRIAAFLFEALPDCALEACEAITQQKQESEAIFTSSVTSQAELINCKERKGLCDATFAFKLTATRNCVERVSTIVGLCFDVEKPKSFTSQAALS